MSSITALMRADARLAILQALAEDPGYSLNHRILRSFVERFTAISLSEDEVRGHIAWLEDQGALTAESVPPFTIAKLTDKGLELSRGRTSLDGVSRPSPSQV